MLSVLGSIPAWQKFVQYLNLSAYNHTSYRFLYRIGFAYRIGFFISYRLHLVECYSNHTITRISIQTAGLSFGGTGLCSYRVRGVDGICASILL